MLPLIIAAGLLGAGAYYALKLIQGMRASMGSGGGGEGESLGDQAGDQPSDDFIYTRPKLGWDELIQKVVDGVVFTTKQMVIGEKKVGTERVESEIPADDIEVRKMRGLSELPKVLPRSHALSDDMFYGMAATNKLPVIQHIEKRDLTEPEYGKARNVLLVLQDISGSMKKDDRLPWSIRLNQKLIDKCIEQGAEYVLIPFESYPYDPVRASSKEELEELKMKLNRVIYDSEGGTSFDEVLLAAVGFLEREQFAEKRIILVTDGEDSISDEVVNRLKESGANLHSIVIAGENSDLRHISDKYDVLMEYI